jgi:perosamine synthetase
MQLLPHRIISASLSPDTEPDDIRCASAMVFQPWKWKTGRAVARVVRWFEHNYPGYSAFTLNSGRSALHAILQAFDIGAGDEVLLQAFTCVAVPNSVLWVGARPVYVDIDSSLNIDIIDAGKKITSKTRAIIVQHTFGVCADMEKVLAFAEKHKILVIEDCAHSLGAEYHRQKAGTFGDAAFFSFGRDKVISSVFGGAAIIKQTHHGACRRIREFCDGLKYPPMFWILQQLLHPLVFSIVLPLYTFGIGKLILLIFQRMKLLSFPVHMSEKSGGRPSVYPTRYPNALAVLILRQLSKLDRYNNQRIGIAEYYRKYFKGNKQVNMIQSPEGSIYLRFSVTVADPSWYFRVARKRGILLGNWYHNVIDPAGVSFSSLGYTPDSCPRARQTALHILNLPTRISQSEAARVSQCFQ